ncbi:MAG: hypothetical protein ACOWWO_18585 [Peptococcaceae bacterium]
MRCYVDENHSYYKDLAEKIARIVYNKDFITLEAELELVYSKTGFEYPKFQAFQDALYSFLSQDEGLKPVKAF